MPCRLQCSNPQPLSPNPSANPQLQHPDIQLHLPRRKTLRNRRNLWTDPRHQNKIVQIYSIEDNMPKTLPVFFPTPFPRCQSVTIATTTTYAEHPVPKTCKNRGKTCKNLQKLVKTARKLAKTCAKMAKTCPKLQNDAKIPAQTLPQFSRARFWFQLSTFAFPLLPVSFTVSTFFWSPHSP